jgi:uncharacterized protein (TIGR03086 family)
VEVEPGRRLVFTWGWEDGGSPAPGGSTVTVTLEPAEGGTTVCLVHEGLTDAEDRDHSQGWDVFLARLLDAARCGNAGLSPRLDRPREEWDLLTSAEATLAVCEHVLSQMGPGDGKVQTPCAQFDVDRLAEHLCTSVAALGRGADVEVEPDPAAPLEVRMADLAQPVLEGWRRRGIDGEVNLGPGPFPAEQACGILSLEFLVHAWDFAQATGRAVAPDDRLEGLSEYVLGLAKSIIRPQARDGNAFAAEVEMDADAGALPRLVAYTGRRP